MLVLQVNKEEEIVVESINREHKSRDKDTIGIKNEMTYMRNDLGMAWDKAGTSGASLASTKVQIIRIASEIYRVRERSKEAKADQRAAVKRDKAAAVRERIELLNSSTGRLVTSDDFPRHHFILAMLNN